MRKLVRCLLAIALLTATPLGFAQAERFPSKPVQIIVTGPPGSQSDILMRFLAAEAAKLLGQAVIIVNQASAAGTIGAEQAKRAPADGYTLLMGGNTLMAANVHLMKSLSYDPVRDFDPITMLSVNPLVLVVRGDMPVKTLPEFIAYAKARPGQLNFGVGNSGNKVSVELMKSMTGITATEITYKGAPPAMLDLVAGRVDFIFADLLVAEPFVKQGAIRPLAVTSPVRMATWRALPTVADAGLPGYKEIVTFLGLYAPRGTPKAAIDRLNEAFVSVINSKEGQEFYERTGLGPKSTTPQGLGDYNKDQIALWEQLVKVSGLQPQ